MLPLFQKTGFGFGFHYFMKPDPDLASSISGNRIRIWFPLFLEPVSGFDFHYFIDPDLNLTSIISLIRIQIFASVGIQTFFLPYLTDPDPVTILTFWILQTNKRRNKALLCFFFYILFLGIGLPILQISIQFQNVYTQIQLPNNYSSGSSAN